MQTPLRPAQLHREDARPPQDQPRHRHAIRSARRELPRHALHRFSSWVCWPKRPAVYERSDPVGILAAIRQHHRLRAQSGQKHRTKPIVMRLTTRSGLPGSRLLCFVQVFGRRHDETMRALRKPASEKRHSTKSREVSGGGAAGSGRRGRYGDFVARSCSRMFDRIGCCGRFGWWHGRGLRNVRAARVVPAKFGDETGCESMGWVRAWAWPAASQLESRVSRRVSIGGDCVMMCRS